MKTCSKCNATKTLDSFSCRKTAKDGLHPWCHDCVKQYNAEHYVSNLEKHQAKNKKWAWDNREYNKERNKEWVQANKDHRKDYKRKYRQEYREEINRYKREKYKENMEDSDFRLREALRSRFKKVVKQKNTTQKSRDFVGCSIQELREHLESQFVDGMNWDNYGEWQIDHIIPVASFDLTTPSQIHACFHYTNLQPLWAKENASKGDRIK